MTVTDNGEPGSSDELGLQVDGRADLSFSPVTLSGGNIQYRDVPLGGGSSGLSPSLPDVRFCL